MFKVEWRTSDGMDFLGEFICRTIEGAWLMKQKILSVSPRSMIIITKH